MKGAERALYDAEERFRKAFEEAPIGMALVALDGAFMRVNRAFTRIVGYEAEELAALTFQAITHPAEVEADVAIAQRLVRGDIPRGSFSKRYIRKDGAVIPAELSVSMVRDRDGRPQYFVTQVQDVAARVQAEAALRKSEEDFRMLIDHASDAIFIADPRGAFLDVNCAACLLLDYRREELVTMALSGVTRPEDRPHIEETWARVHVAPGRVEIAEWLFRRRNGAVVPVEISTKVLPDGRWVAFARDISERKRVEGALLRSEESLRRAQRVAHLGSWDWDLRSDVVVRSPEMLAMFGVDESYASGDALALMRFVASEDRSRAMAAVHDAVHGGGPFALELRIVCSDGTERVVLVQAEVTLEGGVPARLVGTLLDITERKRVEQEREASHRWLRIVLEQAAVGLLLVHPPPEARVEANARALAMIGRPLESTEQYAGLLGGTDGRRVPLEDLPSARALRGERVDSVEYVLNRPGASPLPVLASAAPILGDDGRILGAVVAFQDVSAAKELDRLRAEWSSVVAHDLRQPINTISLTAAMLSRALSDPRLERAARQIESAARRLGRMVADLMDLSRLEARRLELNRERMDVVAAVRATIDRLAPEAPGRAIEVKVHGEPPCALADPDRVAQIVENLLTNAVKYGLPGTEITVEVSSAPEGVAVATSNDGRALSPEECEQLFQRFYRTKQGRVSGLSGSGLGLYIARELVEAHGGRIGVACTPPGRITFRFTLPAAS